MDNQDFFGDVFDAPDDDPLLNEAVTTGTTAQADQPSDQGPPSWVGEDGPLGPLPDASAAAETEPDRKTIVIDQRGGVREGFDAVNQAVRDGWHVVQISLKNTDGPAPFVSETGHRFELTLEKNGPQSLFDFAGAV